MKIQAQDGNFSGNRATVGQFTAIDAAPMNVSIGIMAHNEEKNLPRLLDILLRQKQSFTQVMEILVISDGSTDKTNEILEQYSKKAKIIKPIISQERSGKFQAVNEFIRRSRSQILVMCSADILFGEHTLDQLVRPFSKKDLIMTVSRPIPINKGGILSDCNQINFQLHHVMSTIQPKATDLIAFRKRDIHMPKTITDEEYLLATLSKQGMVQYLPEVTFLVKGPTKISEFISQIRRNYAGHLFLKRELGHAAITSRNIHCLKEALTIESKFVPAMSLFIALQAIGRILGLFDYMFQIKNVIWKIATTTKDLPLSGSSANFMKM